MKNGKDSQKKPTNNTALIKNDITVDTGSNSYANCKIMRSSVLRLLDYIPA